MPTFNRRYSCRDLQSAVLAARQPGESQSALAERAGMTQGTISSILIGKDRGVNLTTAKTIANRLGFKLEDIPTTGYQFRRSNPRRESDPQDQPTLSENYIG